MVGVQPLLQTAAEALAEQRPADQPIQPEMLVLTVGLAVLELLVMSAATDRLTEQVEQARQLVIQLELPEKMVQWSFTLRPNL